MILPAGGVLSLQRTAAGFIRDFSAISKMRNCKGLRQQLCVLTYTFCFVSFSFPPGAKTHWYKCIYQVYFQWRLDGVHRRTLMFRSDADNKIEVGYTFLWLCDLPDTTPLPAGASSKQAQAWALACCPVRTSCSTWCCYALRLVEEMHPHQNTITPKEQHMPN